MECSKNGIKKEGESCTLNNNCIYPKCINKLDKEAFAKDFCINHEKITYRPLEITQEYRIYKAGLEHAENHYISKLEEQEILLNQYQEDYIRLCKYKVETKKLLKELNENLSFTDFYDSKQKIEEFLTK